MTTVNITIIGSDDPVPGTDTPPDGLTPLPAGAPEPPLGSVVLIHAAGRVEPALHCTSGWVTPTTWIVEDWPWTEDTGDIDVYVIYEGDS